MKRFIGIASAVAATAALTLSTAGVANAGLTDVTKANYFRCHTYNGTSLEPTDDGSYCRFVDVGNNGDDSPLDSNDRALVVKVMTGDFAEAYTRKSLNLDRDASTIQNLSFDIRTSDIQGGSPRIVLAFASPLAVDGSSYLFLDAANCNQPISETWSRADFTGYTGTGCTIYTSNGTAYSSGGGLSAYDAFLAANPDAYVSYDYFVVDAPGTYYVDRISLGTGYLYGYSKTRAKTCTTEASC